ncbi:MAG: EF-hand domain-containing protein [Candidatus Thermoplasmatota archaeon]|nr:EF-hand domain-containing protein [Candidatus Thermoplasmatota archaeon]
MFSGRISDAVAKQIEKKIAENNDLNALSNSELADLAVEFVGDAPPSSVPRETVIEILSQQPQITEWRSAVKQRAVEAAKEKVSEVAANVDPRMADMIKQQFGQWLQNSGLSSVEITTKIDTNSDGKITDAELRQFITNLSGTNPPDWVSVTLMNILDTDNNGVIEVQELWSYLGAIGFSVPSIDAPVIEEQVVSLPDSTNETNDEVPEIDIDSELEQITDSAPLTPPVNDSEMVQEETVTEEHHEPIEVELSDTESSVNTSIEIGIERLHSTRLHRESVEVINSTMPGLCKLMVDRVERTLMVTDSYRGGMTAVGLLDGGPYSVAVLFEPVHNDKIEAMLGKELTFTGQLYEWSSGLRQAKLKAVEFNH